MSIGPLDGQLLDHPVIDGPVTGEILAVIDAIKWFSSYCIKVIFKEKL